MSKNKKTNPTKVKKVAAKIKKKGPNLEINYSEMPDPFAFGLNVANKVVKKGNQIKKAILKKLPDPKVLNSMVNNKAVKEAKKNLDGYVNSTNNGIFNSVEATNAGTMLAERVINSITSTVSAALEKNTALSQDMLKCRDAKDCLSFQQKIFEVNFTNLMNCYLDISFAMQAFVSKNMQITSQYNEKNIKCLTGEII